jgi:exodeoxyribonuclease VII large subunit
MSSVNPERDVYTVGRLNREARVILESGLPALWIEGEISNFSCPASGHWYFTLKDREAQIRCAMFRARNLGTGFRPRDGQQVLLRGRISLYEPRGDYQLIAERMEDAGEGALRREFERQSLLRRGCLTRPSSGRCPSCHSESQWSPPPPARPSAMCCIYCGDGFHPQRY